MTERYTVLQEDQAWCYVLRDGENYGNGPWRYKWEAQREADRLNAAQGESWTDEQSVATDKRRDAD
jgi:hypothetical protein